MMTIDEYRQQYQGIRSSEVRELISTDTDFSNNTERLYESIYHARLNKSCSNCWFDAYILIMRTNLEKLKAMQEKQFDLRAGVVLVDPHGDPAKTVTQRNLTDELALYHLQSTRVASSPSIYPNNWEQLAVQSGIDEKKASSVPNERACYRRQKAAGQHQRDRVTIYPRRRERRGKAAGKSKANHVESKRTYETRNTENGKAATIT